MAIVDYSKQDEYDLVHSGQDCMGWTVTDQAGNSIGKVTEMLIDTDKEAVDSIIIDNMKRVPAADFALSNNQVVVRGVMDEKASTQTKQTTQTAPQATAATAQNYAPVPTRAANENEISIPIVEEQLRVGKRTVESGAARVRTNITETPVEQQVKLREEHVHVERRTVDLPVDAASAASFAEGTIDITTQAEVPVVAKEARVVEEVLIGKEVTEHQETIRDTVKRTEVDIDELNSDKARSNTNSNR